MRLEPKNSIVCSEIVSGNVLNKLVQLNNITQRGLEADPFPLGTFNNFSGKNSQFTANWNTFHTFLEPFERTKSLKFKNYLKGLNLLRLLPHLLTAQVQMQVKYKIRLNACILGLNVLRDLPAPPDCVAVLRGQKLYHQYRNTFVAYYTTSCTLIGFHKNTVLRFFY